MLCPKGDMLLHVFLLTADDKKDLRSKVFMNIEEEDEEEEEEERH